MDDIIIDNQPLSVMVDKHGKISLKVFSFGNYLYNLFIKSLLMALLLCINFSLFVRAGNYDIFEEGAFYSVTGAIMIKIFLCSLILMFLLSFSRILQNVLLAFVAGIFVMAMLNQFALFDRYTFLSDTIKIYINEQVGEFVYGISDIVSAIIFSVLVFCYLSYASRANLAYLSGTLLILSSYILFGAYMNEKVPSGWDVEYDNHVNGAGKGKKIINIMLSNAASWAYLDNLNPDVSANLEQEKISPFQSLKNIMLGFAVNNGFRLYPNAYISRTNSAENISSVLNFGKYHPSQLKVYYNNNHSWDFDKLSSHLYQLNENKFQSLFADANYKLSVYQSRYVDLCQKHGEISVDRCVSKVNIPSNVNELAESPESKQSILLAQWLESTGLIESSGRFYHNVLGTVLDTTGISEDGYKKLYVLNSLDVLDLAIDDIAKDKGNGMYLLFLDLPADMFVYNEFCMLKPKNQWLTMDVPSWEKDTAEARKKRFDAYAEQYSCIWGKLQSFIDSLNKNNSLQNSVIVLQGISAPDDGNNAVKNDAKIKFGSQQNVLFAIYDPLNKNLLPDARLCNSGELLYSYLYNKNQCSKLAGLAYKEEELKSLEKLEENMFSADEIKNAQTFYKHWYKYWLKAASSDKVSAPIQVSEKAPAAKDKKNNPVLSEIEDTKVIENKPQAAMVVDEGKEALVKNLAQATQEIEAKKAKENSAIEELPTNSVEIKE